MSSILITGSQDIEDYSFLVNTLDLLPWSFTTIVTGQLSGIESLAIKYATTNHYPVDYHIVNWARDGKSALYLRSLAMIRLSDYVLVCYSKRDKYTRHVIRESKRRGKTWHEQSYGGWGLTQLRLNL